MVVAASATKICPARIGSPSQDGICDSDRFLAAGALARLGRRFIGRTTSQQGKFFQCSAYSPEMDGASFRQTELVLPAVGCFDVPRVVECTRAFVTKWTADVLSGPVFCF